MTMPRVSSRPQCVPALALPLPRQVSDEQRGILGGGWASNDAEDAMPRTPARAKTMYPSLLQPPLPRGEDMSTKRSILGGSWAPAGEAEAEDGAKIYAVDCSYHLPEYQVGWS